jgi:hypothetical protein
MTEPERAACPEDPRLMREQNLGPFALSKNLEDRIGRAEGERRECQDPECGNPMTVQPLEFEVRTNAPCDSRQGWLLDSALEVEGPVHDATQRGFHSGGFRRRVEGTLVVGEFTGITNAGTHRGPIIQECQRYHHLGFMEGRFCGAVEETEEKSRGRRLFGTYRLRMGERSGEGLPEQELAGIREGAEFLYECRG